MTLGGWVTMIISVGAVVSLFVWCLFRVIFHVPPDEVSHLRSEANITPKDRA